MSSIELVVCICVMAVVAAVFVPGYITYTQQSRVLALVLPRLQLLESNITMIYVTQKRLPSDDDLPALMSGIDHENLEVKLTNGVIVLTVNAPDFAAPIHILDGTTLVATPVIGGTNITAWHLDGELAQRLGISQ
ncbi:MAG: hypothetical protein HGA96_10805 [Desulfobulbaceae bacterium]|nr:hypothetical protein [Desulfobulbaceae bacterium]